MVLFSDRGQVKRVYKVKIYVHEKKAQNIMGIDVGGPE